MESGFGQLFLSVQSRINALASAVRYIDQDLGQLEYYPENGRPAVSWPCVLIDIEATNSGDLSQGVQWLELAVHVRIGFSPFSSANSLAPDISKEKALQFYEIETAVYIALQGWDCGGIVQPLTRQGGIATEKREDPFRVRVMTFTTATEDDSAAWYHKRIAAQLNPETDIIKPSLPYPSIPEDEIVHPDIAPD